MAGFEPWDIVLVPFPYTDRPVQQRRPALVIGVLHPGGTDMAWVLMITSASHRAWPGDVAIDNPSAAGLPAPSVVRVAKVATIEAAAATRLGQLPTGAARHHVLEHARAVFDGASLTIEAI